jgi:hypothetical protein
MYPAKTQLIQARGLREWVGRSGKRKEGDSRWKRRERHPGE